MFCVLLPAACFLLPVNPDFHAGLALEQFTKHWCDSDTISISLSRRLFCNVLFSLSCLQMFMQAWQKLEQATKDWCNPGTF
jgi:hypothetical protein